MPFLFFCAKINDEVCEMHTKIELDDELVKECKEVLGFEKGRFTACVKQEIRRYINKNLVIPKKEHIDNGHIIKDVIRKHIDAQYLLSNI